MPHLPAQCPRAPFRTRSRLTDSRLARHLAPTRPRGPGIVHGCPEIVLHFHAHSHGSLQQLLEISLAVFGLDQLRSQHLHPVRNARSPARRVHNRRLPAPLTAAHSLRPPATGILAVPARPSRPLHSSEPAPAEDESARAVLEALTVSRARSTLRHDFGPSAESVAPQGRKPHSGSARGRTTRRCWSGPVVTSPPRTAHINGGGTAGS